MRLSPTSKGVAALFMRKEEMRSGGQKEYPKRVCYADGVLANSRRPAQEFAEMVRGLEGD